MIVTGLIALVIFSILAATPITWLLTLFLGNLGLTELGFLELLPGVLAALAFKVKLTKSA